MIKVIDMVACEDDVSINELSSFVDEIHIKDIYKYIKDFATSRAEELMYSTQGRKIHLVEMSENEEGLPHASLYEKGIIIRQIFATRN